MADIFANITEAPPEIVDVIADTLETRAALPSQQEMIRAYLGEIEFPAEAKVLEIGCGTGAICRILATVADVGQVVGVDPSDRLLSRAGELSSGIDKISYLQGDGRALQFENASFDVVILHTILTHVPEPREILSEAHRVLKQNGWLGVCDGDFSTTTVRISGADPLDACVEAFVENFVTDRFLVRKMSKFIQESGFSVQPLRSYGLVETHSPTVTIGWIEKGADALARAGIISTEFAEALKAEARRRAGRGDFFGYMAFASVTARKAVA